MVSSNILSIFTDIPSDTCWFASERLKFTFHVWEWMRSKTYRLKSCSMFIEVKCIFSIFDEWFFRLVWFLVIIWFIRIHTVDSALHSIQKHVYLLGSNWANTGENITSSFNYLNRVINCGVQNIVGIGFCKWILQKFLGVLILYQNMEHISNIN